jgi:hypothetical protein
MGDINNEILYPLKDPQPNDRLLGYRIVDGKTVSYSFDGANNLFGGLNQIEATLSAATTYQNDNLKGVLTALVFIGGMESDSSGQGYSINVTTGVITFEQAITGKIKIVVTSNSASRSKEIAQEYAEESEASAAASEVSRLASGVSASASEVSKLAAGASETAAATSETNAATSETNAATSETNAANSASDAETAETGAVAAKDAIEGKFDFTGASEGDLYRVNSSAVAVPISELLIPVTYFNYGINAPDRVWAADNFGVRGYTPSAELVAGRAYTDLTAASKSFKTLDTSGLGTSKNDRNFRIDVCYETFVSTSPLFLLFWRDASNYATLELNRKGTIKVNSVASDTTTEVYAAVGSANNAPERFIFSVQINWDNRDQRIYIHSNIFTSGIIQLPGFDDSDQLNKIGFFNKNSVASILNYKLELK